LTIFIIAFYLFAEKRTSGTAPSKSVYLNRAALLLAGCIVDWSLARLELIEFSSSTSLPFWLILMWILFAITFDDCFSWLKRRVLVGATLGSIFGPSAYWAASRLSNVEIVAPVYFTLFSSLIWGIIFWISLNTEDSTIKPQTSANG